MIDLLDKNKCTRCLTPSPGCFRPKNTKSDERSERIWGDPKQMAIQVSACGNTFVAHGAYEDRKVLKDAGFDWEPGLKAWTTKNAEVAGRLRKYADSDAKTKIDRSLISVEPWTTCEQYWPEGLDPRAFQTLAARFVLERNYSYVAADPGLGKTIIMALVINAMNQKLKRDRVPVVVVNQPGLCLNTKAELEKWVLKYPVIQIYPGDETYDNEVDIDVLIAPDSLIADELGAHFLLRDRIEYMTRFGDAVLFIDEAQRFNNLESKRTKALFKLAARFEKVVFMSGTPLRNRPHDLYAILSHFAPETIGFKNEHQYGFRYCAGYFDSFHKPNYKGASNVEELFSKVKEKFMYRIRKQDVLQSLPSKTEEIVFLSDGEMPAEIANYERARLDDIHEGDLTRDKITSSPYLSTYRRLLGEHKVEPALEFIQEILAMGDEYILIFAEHIATVDALSEGLKKFKPIVVTGKTTAVCKQARVKEFQAGKSRIFIGNTQACGTGFTLTKATRVIHVEPSWVPADSDQASDRAHRIGQTQAVFVQYLCFRNSLDHSVIESAMKKREVLNKL